MRVGGGAVSGFVVGGAVNDFDNDSKVRAGRQHPRLRTSKLADIAVVRLVSPE